MNTYRISSSPRAASFRRAPSRKHVFRNTKEAVNYPRFLPREIFNSRSELAAVNKRDNKADRLVKLSNGRSSEPISSSDISKAMDKF